MESEPGRSGDRPLSGLYQKWYQIRILRSPPYGTVVFELVVIILFIWLSIKAIGLAVRLTWGATKIMASILMVIALPALIVCFLFASGVILLIPILLIVIAFGILKGIS